MFINQGMQNIFKIAKIINQGKEIKKERGQNTLHKEGKPCVVRYTKGKQINQDSSIQGTYQSRNIQDQALILASA